MQCIFWNWITERKKTSSAKCVYIWSSFWSSLSGLKLHPSYFNFSARFFPSASETLKSTGSRGSSMAMHLS